LSLDAFIAPGYFRETGGEVLCFGAGGSAIATLLHLINKPEVRDRPRRFILVNRSAGRLEHARQMVGGLRTDIQIEYVLNADPAQNDRQMASLPPHSVVINATGMGKDSPGSPITWESQFPLHGVAWEFNYRGELDFLHLDAGGGAGAALRPDAGIAGAPEGGGGDGAEVGSTREAVFLISRRPFEPMPGAARKGTLSQVECLHMSKPFYEL
jgi:hypothetical protein